MITEQERIYDECMSQIDEMFNNFNVYQANSALDGIIKGLKKLQESEEKTMLHNVTVRKAEKRKLEEFWIMRAVHEIRERDSKTNRLKINFHVI